MEKTFAMIKPHAVKEKKVGKIIDMIEQSGFSISCMKKILMDQNQAEDLYQEHKERPFFQEMVTTITSNPVIVMTLEKEGAVAAWRELMGATNPADAEQGTIRALYGTSIGSNAVHGSDSLDSSSRERAIFFEDCSVE